MSGEQERGESIDHNVRCTSTASHLSIGGVNRDTCSVLPYDYVLYLVFLGVVEERQTLLSGETARESEDERPALSLPPQLPPQARKLGYTVLV